MIYQKRSIAEQAGKILCVMSCVVTSHADMTILDVDIVEAEAFLASRCRLSRADLDMPDRVDV